MDIDGELIDIVVIVIIIVFLLYRNKNKGQNDDDEDNIDWISINNHTKSTNKGSKYSIKYKGTDNSIMVTVGWVGELQLYCVGTTKISTNEIDIDTSLSSGPSG